MKKVIYATVVYPCKSFDSFINDYLVSVFGQTEQNFELLLILDDVDVQKVKDYIQIFNSIEKPVHLIRDSKKRSPNELRKKLVDISYELNGDILIFSDFDENVALNRVEVVLQHINGYDFAFNDFYLVDQFLDRLDNKSFFSQRDIPSEVFDWRQIKSFNFIGFGSLSINLSSYDYKNMIFPNQIKALDWFLCTHVLYHGGKGVKLMDTYANYRQHDDSYVGFNFNLDERKLMLGLDVKIAHYGYFKSLNSAFLNLYNEIFSLKSYLDKNGKEDYINVVNMKFKTDCMCWWENIKLLEELGDEFK